MDPKIYLDYAASTPVDQRVREAMEPYDGEKFGNPGSLHSFGQAAIAALDASRETITRTIGVDFRELILTASATEANNLVLRGAARAAQKKGLKNPKIIVSTIEHESVLETARDLAVDGVEISYLPVDEKGFVRARELESMLDERTVAVSVMYANNEVGTIQPIAAIADAIRAYKDELQKTHQKKNSEAPVRWYPFFHTDVAQAFQFLDCTPERLGVDFMTISAHKIYGPKGAGALYGRNLNALVPQMTGGGQEFGLRSGTENIPAIVGFAKAVELIGQSRTEENKKIAELRNELWDGIKKIFPQAEINGTNGTGASAREDAGEDADEYAALPNILNVYFPGHEAQDLIIKFDRAGLAASSGSACHSRAHEPSYVIEAMGFSKERAASSIRFSLGRPTTAEDIASALSIIKRTLA
jgi:cysteine desulfurase